LGGNGQQSEPVGLFLAAGAVCGVAPAVNFRDEVVKVWKSHEASTP
jgi:hypothetical protein